MKRRSDQVPVQNIGLASVSIPNSPQLPAKNIPSQEKFSLDIPEIHLPEADSAEAFASSEPMYSSDEPSYTSLQQLLQSARQSRPDESEAENLPSVQTIEVAAEAMPSLQEALPTATSSPSKTLPPTTNAPQNTDSTELTNTDNFQSVLVSTVLNEAIAQPKIYEEEQIKTDDSDSVLVDVFEFIAVLYQFSNNLLHVKYLVRTNSFSPLPRICLVFYWRI